RMDPEIVFAGRIRTDFPCDICFSTITELDCPVAVVRSLITPPSAASFASFAKVDSAHRRLNVRDHVAVTLLSCSHGSNCHAAGTSFAGPDERLRAIRPRDGVLEFRPV